MDLQEKPEMRNVAVLVGNLLELVDSSFEVVKSSSEVAEVVGMALSVGKRSFPSEVAD